MTVARKINTFGTTEFKTQNPDDPNVRDPKHAHELGGTLGMTVGGVVGGVAAGTAAAATIGAVGGAAFAGPLGAVAGAAIGGAIGGSLGENIAREANPTLEEEYWEKNYLSRPYIVAGYNFESYRPAYRAGISGFRSNPNQSFDDLEPSLRNNWNIERGDSRLDWNEAQFAARDAFNRLAATRR